MEPKQKHHPVVDVTGDGSKIWCCKEQYCISSVDQSCLTLHYPMDCRMPGFPVHHQLPESAQTHVHQVGDAIQPSHPLLSPSPPALNFSQHQGLFQSVIHIRRPKYWNFSFSISPSNQYSGLISSRIGWLDLLAVKELSRSFPNTTVWKHQFFGSQLSLWFNSPIHAWLLVKS